MINNKVMKKYLLIPIFGILGTFIYGQSAYSKPYQYRDPAPVDITPLGNAATTLQNRYNNNIQTVGHTVKKIKRDIYESNMSNDNKNEVIRRFNSVISSLNSQRIDYSSTNQTNAVINYLYDSVNKIIQDVL